MNIEGILVPIVTPFTPDNRIDTEKLSMLVNEFINRNVTGIVACGTTGEYYSFSKEEREVVLKTIHTTAAGRCTLIAGISDLSTELAAQRAIEAQNLGYDGLMLSAPPYSLPSQQGIIEHFEYIASKTDLPIIIYNFPARVGIEIEFETIAHLAKHPNIIGIKESSGNFSNALRMLQANFKNFDIICGCDDQPLDFFSGGQKVGLQVQPMYFLTNKSLYTKRQKQKIGIKQNQFLPPFIQHYTPWSQVTITKKQK